MVYTDESGGAVTLDLLSDRLRTLGREQAIEICGESGFGRTTALRHIAALVEGTDVRCLDEPGHAELMDVLREHPVVFSSIPRARPMPQIVGSWTLAPWGTDQFVEFLLARHPARIRTVMTAVLDDLDMETLEGIPELCAAVLDRMAGAASGAAPRVAWAVRQLMDEAVGSAGARDRLDFLIAEMIVPKFARPKSQPSLTGPLRLLKHAPVRLRIAVDRIVETNRHCWPCAFLPKPGATSLLRACIGRATVDDDFAKVLQARLLESVPALHPSAASILHAASRPWLPETGPLPRLGSALLPGWKPTRSDLRGVNACKADLREAELSRTDLSDARLTECRLVRARLCGTLLHRADLSRSTLIGADLSGAQLDGAEFEETDLSGARLDNALAPKANFTEANLTASRFVRASLPQAYFRRAVLDEADFSGADLAAARLSELDLRRVCLASAVFTGTIIAACRLEGLILHAPDFRRAVIYDCDLSAAVMRNADFRSARVHNCGLMDVEWEGADLREADLSRSTFHGGSSRSGLVAAGHILPASEGSRTGFYTDDSDDQTHKAPEDIRKANLCGADLRDAHVFDVDFYLVDLRHAKFTTPQAEWFRKCVAILKSK